MPMKLFTDCSSLCGCIVFTVGRLAMWPRSTRRCLGKSVMYDGGQAERLALSHLSTDHQLRRRESTRPSRRRPTATPSILRHAQCQLRKNRPKNGQKKIYKNKFLIRQFRFAASPIRCNHTRVKHCESNILHQREMS